MKIKKVTIESKIEDVFGDDCLKRFKDPDSKLSRDFPMYFEILNHDSLDYFKFAKFMKCSYGDEVLGVCTFSFDPAEGDDYYVLNDLEKAKSCQENGVGTLLVNAVIDQAKEEGKKYVYLLSPEFNVKYYERFGFVKGRFSHSKRIDDDARVEYPQLAGKSNKGAYKNYFMTLEL